MSLTNKDPKDNPFIREILESRSQVPPEALEVGTSPDGVITIVTDTTGEPSRQIRLYKGIWPQERVDGKWRLLPEIRRAIIRIIADTAVAQIENGDYDEAIIIRENLGDVLEADE